MKELSINEKAKAYDEAIERAKKLYGNEIAEEIFHELKECDDERIKKNCIHFLELQKQHHAATFEIEECIDWLEKQGKNSTDKIEHRFNVGDWVVFITSESAYQVEKKENYEYTLRNIHGGLLCVSFSNEELIREWTIEDAKDGDVLVHSSFMFGDFIFIYNNTAILQAYCYYSSERNRFIIEDREHHCPWNMQEVTPATKEQRDALMKAMNDAGYEWDTEKKELKRKRNMTVQELIDELNKVEDKSKSILHLNLDDDGIEDIEGIEESSKYVLIY